MLRPFWDNAAGPGLLRRTVADSDVAADAVIGVVGEGAMREQVGDQGTVTLDAVEFEDASVARSDPDWLVEVFQRERLGVPEAVLRLGHVFADKVVRQVTVHAGGVGMVAGLLPAVVLLVHDMAIGTRARVAAEIRPPAGEPEREKAEPQHHA